MNSLAEDARLEVDLIYKSILDEAEIQFPYKYDDPDETKLVDAHRQLFVNATLRNVLEENVLLKLTAQRKSIRLTGDAKKVRNEEIVFKALKFTQMKLAHQYQISVPAISRIIKITINEIVGNTVDDDLTAGEALEMYRKDLEKYFIQKKIEARYEHRINNKQLRINNNCANNTNIGDGTFG